MKFAMLMMLALAACAVESPTAAPMREAALVTPVTFTGACAPVRFTVACDVQFIGDYDLGTGFVNYRNVTSWEMLSGAATGKTVAPFTFRARWRDSWGRVGPWSQWVDFSYNTATGVTTNRGMRSGAFPPTCFGTICIPAPTIDRLSYAVAP